MEIFIILCFGFMLGYLMGQPYLLKSVLQLPHQEGAFLGCLSLRPYNPRTRMTATLTIECWAQSRNLKQTGWRSLELCDLNQGSQESQYSSRSFTRSAKAQDLLGLKAHLICFDLFRPAVVGRPQTAIQSIAGPVLCSRNEGLYRLALHLIGAWHVLSWCA